MIRVVFDRCGTEDFDDYLYLRNDTQNALWTGHKELPDRMRLENWYTAQLKRTDRVIYIVRKESPENSAVGYLYLDWIAGRRAVEVAYGIHTAFSGMGLGTLAVNKSLTLAKEAYPSAELVFAWIIDDNQGSVKCVLRNGFVKTGDIREAYAESFGKTMIMHRYEHKIDF